MEDLVGEKIEEDTGLLVSWLTEDENGVRGNIGVVVIMGMGGTGKTTLAKKIFKDSKIEEFEFKVWACVSKEVKEIELLNCIIQETGGEPGGSQGRSELVISLERVIKGKKFFLVLDDVWPESVAVSDGLLQAPMSVGACGSRLLVTTRDERVVNAMKATKSHHVGKISDQDGCSLLIKQGQPYLSKSIENMENIRIRLSQSVDKSMAIVTVDALKKLGIDHYFGEEISALLSSLYHDMHKGLEESDNKITDIALQFKLLREAGYNISSDVFQRFMDENGEFKQSLSNNIEGLMSLHEASFLNMGEDILYKANEFSTKHLTSMKYLGTSASALVRHTLEHPHHMSLKQYKAKHYLPLLSLTRANDSSSMEELAQFEFHANQQFYQYEFKKITRWWKDLGLAKELTFARDQILKWYLWSMTVLSGPQFSKHRLEITKAVSFVYLIDDIFDIMGNAEDLAIFTQTVNSWEDSSALPRYMRICFIALQEVTCSIAKFVQEEYGWDPMSFLRKSWATLCNAFLVEAKWFAIKEVPSANEYLTNGVISSGVPLVLKIISFLLGHRITDETVHLIDGGSPLVSCPAKILRLWDDLGSAKDEDQEGFDGSYVECYMKDNPSCSIDAARAHTKNLISKSWEELNKEYFFNTSFPPYFAEASMNCARMVRVMYNYNEEQKLPMMNDYIQTLLSAKITS